MPDPTNPVLTATALAVGTTGTHTLNTATLNDYYRFTLSGRSSVNLTLNGLDANVDVQLLGSGGAVLQQSTNTGTTTDDVNATDLSAGVYYLRVLAASGTTNAHYTLGLQAQKNAKTDLLWRNYSTGEDVVWTMNGTSSLSAASLQTITDLNWQLVGAADFTGDGQADLVWHHNLTGSTNIWQMQGTSMVSNFTLPPSDPNWQLALVSDLNGDGQADLVWRNNTTGADRVWQMQGTTSVSTLTLPAVADLHWQLVGSGDLNGDGQADLVWRNNTTGEDILWQMNGTTLLPNGGVSFTAVTDVNWRIEGVSDLNGDDHPDLIWRNLATGEDILWQMNGTTLLPNGGVSFRQVADVHWQMAASFAVYGAPSDVHLGGSSTSSAFDLGTLNGQATYQSTLNSSGYDYYRFALPTANPNVYARVTASHLDLLSSSGSVLQSAATGGLARLQSALASGTYYLRVSGALGYTLVVADTSAPPSVTTSLVNDTARSGTNTDQRTADPTVSVQVGSEHWLGSLSAGFNTTAPANFLALEAQLGSRFTLTPTQLQQINGGVALMDGSYVLHLRATGVDDVTALTTDLTFTLDTMTSAPSGLHLTTGTGNTTNVTTPTLTGQAEVGALVKVYGAGNVLLGQGVADSTGIWQAPLTALADGTYNVTAISTDVAGNVSAASMVLTLVLDRQAPLAPTLLPLAAADDTGESASDGITARTTPTLTGQAEAGTAITLFNNGVAIGQTRTNASGVWQLTTTTLPQGLASLSATATDAAGNISPLSAPLVLTIDSVAPAAPTGVRLTAGSDSGRSSTDAQTKVNTPTVIGSAAPNVLVQLWGEGQLLGQQKADAIGNWQIQTPTLADGAYVLSAFAIDLAGNRSPASLPLALIIDTQALTPPTSLHLSATSDTGSSASDGVTANPTPMVVGQSAANALVQLFDQNQVIGQTTADGTGAWQITTPTLTEGAHDLTATATDVAGNVSVNSAPLSLTIDTALPTLNVTTALTSPLVSGTRLTGTVAGTGSAIVSVSYHWDDRAAIALAFDAATGTFDQALDFTGITSNTHTLTLTTTDTAGNVKTLQPTVTVALGAAPVITAALAQDTAPGGLTNADGVTHDPTLSGQVTTTQPLAVLRAGFGTGTGVNYGDITARVQADGSFTLTRTQLEALYGRTLLDAHYTLSLQAVDTAGNVTTLSPLAFDLDTQAPTAPSNLSLAPAGLYAVAIAGTAEANAQVQLFEGTTLVGEAVANATGNWRVTTSQLRNGTHSLTATATDAAGNTSPATTATPFTITTLVPATPQGLRLTAATDSGQSQTDNITNDATPTIVGTAEAGATVRLFRAQQLLGETTAAATGAWSIALTTALPEGEQSLSVVAHNAIGDSQTATLLTTIDTVAPTTTQLNVLATGSTTATALANGVTLTTGTRLLGQLNGTTSAIASLQYQLGTSPAVTVPVVGNGLFNYRLDLTGSSSGNNQTLTVMLTDVAGNTTTLAPFLVNISATNNGGGEAPFLLAQLMQDTGSNTTDGWTYVPGIAGVASAPGVITSLLATFDPAATAVFQDLTSLLQPDGTFTLDEETLATLAGGALADGAYTLRLRVQTGTNQLAEQGVSFTLDRTAPVTTLPNLIDGIAWERGTHLQGTVVEASAGVNVAYQLETVNGVAVGSAHTLAVTEQAFDQVLDAATLTEETPSNLVLTSTDRAGNAQRSRFQFFIPGARKVTDDDTLPDAPANHTDPKPDPQTAPDPHDPGSWGRVGRSGGWGYWSYPSGGGPGAFTGLPDAGFGPTNPKPSDVLKGDPTSLEGSGYEFTYVESVYQLVHQAIDLISTDPETVSKKAALVHRQDILQAIGQRLNTLIQADGTFKNDQALLDRLRPSMEGLFADAYAPAGSKSGVEPGYVLSGGAWLAQALVTDPLSVREQVFQATLLEVVTEATPGVTDVAQQQALTAAVMALAKTYAWLNPNPEGTVPAGEQDFGFLDALWRLQIPDANGQFKSSSDIAQTLADSVAAVGRLLAGVQDPVRAIQFLNNLVQAASNVTSLKADVKDATFLRELVEFGVEFVKLNPTGMATAGSDAINTFLGTLWNGGNAQQIKQAQGGLNELFDGLDTEAKRLKFLDFAENLLKATEQVQAQDLQSQIHDANFIGSIVGLGSSYAALNPLPATAGIEEQKLELFLNTLWQGQNLQAGAEALTAFLHQSSGDDQQLLDVSRKFLHVLNSVPGFYVQGDSRDAPVISNWLEDAAFYTNLKASLGTGESVFDPSGFYEEIWQASTVQELHNIEYELKSYIAPSDIKIASANSDGLLAQSEMGGENGLGGLLVDGAIVVIGGLLYLVVDNGGKILRAVFHSDTGKDERTEGEKKTIDAVGKLLEGATPTDEKGNPIRNPEEKKGRVGNYVKPGDNAEANEDFDEFAGRLKKAPKDQGDGKRSIDLPDGGSAGVYPKSRSTKEPSIQINLGGSNTVGGKTKLKIRYGNSRATLVIPTA